MNEYMGLYYICEGAGVLMVVGGIWLIYKEKIYLDPSTKEVLNVEVPLIGKLQTNVPALGLFIIGLIALIYPIVKVTTPYLQVEQVVNSDDHPVAVYVAVQAKILHKDGKLVVSVPVLDSPGYEPELIYLAGPITDQFNLELDKQKHGILELAAQHLQDKAHLGVNNAHGQIDPPPDAFK